MYQRATMQIERRRREAADEPRDAGSREKRSDAALSAPLPGEETAAEQHPADEQVRAGPVELAGAVGDKLGRYAQREAGRDQCDAKPPGQGLGRVDEGGERRTGELGLRDEPARAAARKPA